MRPSLAALVFILAACTPPAPPAAQPTTDASTAQAQAPANPYTAALAAVPVSGHWFFLSDEAVFAAAFGPSEDERQLSIICGSGTGEVIVELAHDLSPEQDATLRVITRPQTLDLPARSRTRDGPIVRAELATDAPQTLPLIGMLGAPQDRFAIEVAGQITVFRWDQSIAQTLIECRR